ncbi:MAG: hypothetical protein LBP19_10260 [Treponema sp.]|jgi:hypothetical protein|nr:hypothetical protein [Treponema sp.]
MADESKAVADDLKAITNESEAIANGLKAIADESKAALSNTGVLAVFRRIAPVADGVPDTRFAPARNALFERKAL